MMLTDPRPNGSVSTAQVSTALERANLPSLVMVLYQLTGDAAWLEPPFQPTPGRGLTPHDSGGFDEDTAGVIWAAATEAISAWHHGRPTAVPAPGGGELQRLLSLAVGEEVPEEYAALMAGEMGFVVDRPGSGCAAAVGVAFESAGAHLPATSGDAKKPTVVIVGAGISSIIAAVRLQSLGIDFVVLERNDDVGGVWLTNTYPGAGVDTPSYLYSFSFYPRNWGTHFGKQPEMIAYLREVADHFDLRRHIRFGTTVDEARWDAESQLWTLTTTDAHGRDQISARFLISAVGLFNKPQKPTIAGMSEFTGPVVHTAEWPADLDLEGKRVAVIGTGASAMQVVPAIADRVGSLTIFQRSPQWVAPNGEYFARVPDSVHWLMENVPYYHAWNRFRLAWIFNDRIHPSLQVDPGWQDPKHSLNAVNEGHRRYFTRYIDEQLGERPDLRPHVVPTYPPFGKRMLLDNGWFAALRRDNVALVTDSVTSIDTGGVNTGGDHFDVDVIVLGTGFDVRCYLPDISVIGRDNQSLHEYWGDEDAVAHLGITVPGYPNFFLMYGPNTNGGAGGSYIFIAECQAAFITGLISQALERGMGSLECRTEALDQWVSEVDEAHQHMVWTHPGMTTYYRNRNGRVTVNSPWRVVDYWAMTRHPSIDDFVTAPVDPSRKMYA